MDRRQLELSEQRCIKKQVHRLCAEQWKRDKKEGRSNVDTALVMLGLCPGFTMDKAALERLIALELDRRPEIQESYLIMICEYYGLSTLLGRIEKQLASKIKNT